VIISASPQGQPIQVSAGPFVIVIYIGVWGSSHSSLGYYTDPDAARLTAIVVANPAAFESNPDAARLLPFVIAYPSLFQTDPDAARRLRVSIANPAAFESDPDLARVILP
jgi:hypothetical protein